MNDDMLSLPDLNSELFDEACLKRRTKERWRRDVRSLAYLAAHFKLREFGNFLYTKTLVPTGEGSHPWLYNLGLLDLVRKYPEKVPLPRFIEVETTTVCNKRCFICEYIYWPSGEQVRRHMTLEEFRHIAGQFPVIRWANLTGEGSSFLNRDYPLMIRHLWERFRTSIWLVDHLADITQEQLRRDVFPYVHGIYVSMDAATKQTYETIKAGCDFENVIRNLREITDYKRSRRTPFPHLSFRYIMLKENIHEMPMFLDLINSLARPDEWGGSSSLVEFTGLLYFPEIAKHYLDKVPREITARLMERRDGIEFRFAHAEEDTNPPIECCNAWMEPYIMMPGYVLPCCAVMMSNRRPFLREYSFGNVFEKNFREIWKSDYYSGFRKMVVDPCAAVPRLCAGCRAYRTKHRIDKYGVWERKAPPPLK